MRHFGEREKDGVQGVPGVHSRAETHYGHGGFAPPEAWPGRVGAGHGMGCVRQQRALAPPCVWLTSTRAPRGQDLAPSTALLPGTPLSWTRSILFFSSRRS